MVIHYTMVIHTLQLAPPQLAALVNSMKREQKQHKEHQMNAENKQNVLIGGNHNTMSSACTESTASMTRMYMWCTADQ